MRLFIVVYHEETVELTTEVRVIPSLDAEKAYKLKEEKGGEVRKFDIPDQTIASKLPERFRRQRDYADFSDQLLDLFGGKGKR